MSHSHYVPYNSHIFHVRNFCHSWYLCNIRDSNVLHVFFSFDIRRGFWHICFCVVSVLIILTMSGVLSPLVATGGLRTPDIVRMGFDLLKICCPLRLRRLCIFYVVFTQYLRKFYATVRDFAFHDRYTYILTNESQLIYRSVKTSHKDPRLFVNFSTYIHVLPV